MHVPDGGDRETLDRHFFEFVTLGLLIRCSAHRPEEEHRHRSVSAMVSRGGWAPTGREAAAPASGGDTRTHRRSPACGQAGSLDRCAPPPPHPPTCCCLTTAITTAPQSEVEETLERVKVQNGVEGYVICNRQGLVLRRFPQMSQEHAEQYADSMRHLANKARGVVRDLNPQVGRAKRAQTRGSPVASAPPPMCLAGGCCLAELTPAAAITATNPLPTPPPHPTTSPTTPPPSPRPPPPHPAERAEVSANPGEAA